MRPDALRRGYCRWWPGRDGRLSRSGARLFGAARAQAVFVRRRKKDWGLAVIGSRCCNKHIVAGSGAGGLVFMDRGPLEDATEVNIVVYVVLTWAACAGTVAVQVLMAVHPEPQTIRSRPDRMPNPPRATRETPPTDHQRSLFLLLSPSRRLCLCT